MTFALAPWRQWQELRAKITTSAAEAHALSLAHKPNSGQCEPWHAASKLTVGAALGEQSAATVAMVSGGERNDDL